MTLGSTPVGARNTIGGFCFPSDPFLLFEAWSSGAASLVEEYPDWSPITFFLDWFDLLRSVVKLFKLGRLVELCLKFAGMPRLPGPGE